MINADFLTLLLIGFSTLVLVISETHVAFVTLALCSGYVLSDTVGADLFNFLSRIIDANSFPLYSALQLFLLLFPALLIAHRFRRSQRGAGRFMQQIIPSFALSLVLVLFVFNALSADARAQLVEESYIHSNIGSFANWLIIFAISTALFDVLIQHAGPKRKYKKRRGAKSSE